MPETSLKSARDNLKKASEHYILHKKRQLDKFIAKSPYKPDCIFFQQALGYNAPRPGFSDWVHCIYFEILPEIFKIKADLRPIYLRPRKYSLDLYLGSGDDIALFPSGKLKSYDLKDNYPDQYDPKITLHNLKVLISLLNLVMNDLNPCFDVLKKNSEYTESNYRCEENCLLSLQIEKALQNLIALVDFIRSLPNYRSSRNLAYIEKYLDKAYPKFEEYLKLITVQELKDILDKDICDIKALELAREHVKERHVKSSLEKNHQSASEQRLKLLSLISIIFGIGIFTTFGLMAKRLYDSGGTSINFFKPLSINLRDSVEKTLESVIVLS